MNQNTNREARSGSVNDRVLVRSGTLHSINVSNGGVPKLARGSAWINADGVEGDRQRNLLVHGGPMRAVSIYSLDLIRALQAEGHPIEPGTIGENLTVDGVDWSQMVEGTHVQIGEVELELTTYANPCRHIASAFADGDSNRVGQKWHPGWSRVYARVLHEGRVSPGDRVLIVPV